MSFIALLALSAGAPAITPAPAAAKPICQNTRVDRALSRGTPPTAHPMTAEPNAALIATVLRTVDGCTRPVVVREDIGPKR